MDYRLVWSPVAKSDFEENIEFLLRRWSHKEVRKFILKTYITLAIIQRNPRTFRTAPDHDIRFVPIVPQITLFYRITEGNQIELIRFWNNFKNPSKKGF